METAFNLFLWGVAGTLSLAPLGAGFGALVRGVARANGQAPEATLGEAVSRGIQSGGLFLALLGFLAGVLVGWQEQTLEGGLRVLAIIAAGTMALMLMATGFAALASLCIWLGVRGPEDSDAVGE